MVIMEPSPGSGRGGETLNCFGYEEKGRPTKPKRRERKRNRLSNHIHLV